MNSDKNPFIKSTKEGKLYISSKDFFKQYKVRKIIKDLKNSTIAKQIRNNNKNT